MTIRKIIGFSFGALAIALSVGSCDNIAEDERIIYEKPADVNKCVLVEDFTGQLCINCPNAAQTIEELKRDYGEDAIIAVGIHGGNLAWSTTAGIEGFRSELGDEYYKAVGEPDLPAGRINRRGGTTLYTDWQAQVREEIQKVSPVQLAITNTYREADGTVDISVDMLGVDGSGVSGKLQLWIIEDSIVGMQRMPDGRTNMEYTHNHVLRVAVNGSWGEDITLGEGEQKVVSHSFVLDPAWNTEHVSVVAFVYDNNGVHQAVIAPVISKAGSEDETVE